MRRRIVIAVMLAAANVVAFGCGSFGSADDEPPNTTPDASTSDGAGPGSEDAPSGVDGGSDGADKDSTAPLEAGPRRCDGGAAWFCDEFDNLSGWSADEQGNGTAAAIISSNASSPPHVLRVDAPLNSRGWLNRQTDTATTAITCTFDVTMLKSASAQLVLAELRLTRNVGDAGDFTYVVNVSAGANGGEFHLVTAGSATSGGLTQVNAAIGPLPSTRTTVVLKLAIGPNAFVEARIGATTANQAVPALDGLSGTTQAVFGLGAIAYSGSGGPWALEIDDAQCVFQ